ncbi:MAG: T9SS type A sorting domain-containing protein [Bacteroidales bacterium]|jgi:hypothetical protein
MKKIYLIFAITLGFTIGLNAQSFQFIYEDNVIGDTLKLDNSSPDGLRTDYIHFKNISEEAKTVKVYKEIIQLADEAGLYMCFNGNCLTDTISPSSITIQPNVVYSEFDLQYTYANNNETFARINLINPTTLEPIQSFYVLYTDSTTVSLEKPIKQGITSTNIEAYPNPANNNATIAYSIQTNYKSGKIVVRNMIGATIKTISINGGSTGKQSISTAELPNGVYFYSIIGDGKALSTKKLVVKH